MSMSNSCPRRASSAAHASVTASGCGQPPGPHHLGKPRPHPGVQPICLGPSPGGVRTISVGATRRRRATRVSIPAASETACPARPRSAGAHPTASWIHQCPHCSERLSRVLQKLESPIGQKMRANGPGNGAGLSEYGRDNPAPSRSQTT